MALTPFDVPLLIVLSFGQIGLLISCLVQLAGLRQRVNDIDRRVTNMEKEIS